MAPSPRPCTSLLLPSLLLVLLLVSSSAARVARNQAAQDDHGEVDADGEVAASFFRAEAGDEGCGGGAKGGDGDDDECLMRRTLVAHTDYIYTQGGNHN
ncbi:hypothetical protein ACQJBY_036620 [Aegilops geniculata]